jgi:hypothetical protein
MDVSCGAKGEGNNVAGDVLSLRDGEYSRMMGTGSRINGGRKLANPKWSFQKTVIPQSCQQNAEV